MVHREKTVAPICALLQFYKVASLFHPAKKLSKHAHSSPSWDPVLGQHLIPIPFAEEAPGLAECMNIAQSLFPVFLQIYIFSPYLLRLPIIGKLDIQ